MQQLSKGLTQAQAVERLNQVGENVLAGKKGPGIASMFFSQFKDVMILILAAATLISIVMGEGAEAITIIVIVLMNATMGFLQEYRTEKTLEALKELSAPTARVRRDGQEKEISAREVVPGDIVLFEAGDKMPADGKLVNGTRVSCNESMLTGESLPVAKKETDTLFMGCIITDGHGEAIITATGMATEMGKIAGMMENTQEEPTPLQIKLKQLGKFVALACVTVCLAVALLGFLQGNDFLVMLLTGVSLAVAAIPEGLPAIVTITLALSVGRILKRGAVIRKLHAVETLGCAGVICTDKTGTITQNKMTVQSIWTKEGQYTVTGSGYTAIGTIQKASKPIRLKQTPVLNRLAQVGVLCSNAKIEKKQNEYETTGDPTEIAVLIACAKAGLTRTESLRTWRITAEEPFDSKRKRMSSTVCSKNETKLLCKGAPDLLLEQCSFIATEVGKRPITIRDKKEISGICSSMAEQALRVLGFADSDTPEKGETELCFLGLVGMQDPPRPQVKSAVKKCRQAGIKPVMITGDSLETARAIARQVGIANLGDAAYTGAQLDQMSEVELQRTCMKTSIYARVSPAHKLRIVRAYKAVGQITAMTGDGVNDAPAVKEADIGVAMGLTGTDVTKEASSVVILDDNFATIVAAVEEGRVIYQNIRRFIRYLLTSNLGEVMGMLFGMLLQLPVTLLPIQILLVNLFTDGLPAIALGMEPPADNIMSRKPRPKEEGLFAHGLAATIFMRGTMLGAASCWAYWMVLTMSGDVTIARSACFLTIVTSQMLHIFECRGKGIRFFGNPALLAATAMSMVCAIGSVYLPVAQNIFSTAAVWGEHLIPVIIAVLVGPLLTGIFRLLKKIFS